jgi:carbonic anhydrase
VVEDVKRIRTHPLVPRNIPIYGFIYECATGRIDEVNEASAAGKPILGPRILG